MGAALVIRQFPDMPESEIRAALADRRSRDGHEDGHLYSGSWGVKHGIRIESRTFDTIEDAKNYIDEHSGKHDAILAVKAKTLSKEGKPSAKIVALSEKCRSAENAVYQFPGSIIKRVRAGKSKTRGCAHCGSAIAVAFIRSAFCPVCTKGFLYSATDEKRMQALQAKSKALVAQLNAAEAEERAKLQRRGACPLVWVAGGWCSS